MSDRNPATCLSLVVLLTVSAESCDDNKDCPKCPTVCEVDLSSTSADMAQPPVIGTSPLPLPLSADGVLPSKEICRAFNLTGGVELQSTSTDGGVCIATSTATMPPVRWAAGDYVVAFSREFVAPSSVTEPGLGILLRYQVEHQPPVATAVSVPVKIRNTKQQCICPVLRLSEEVTISDLFIGISVPIGTSQVWRLTDASLRQRMGSEPMPGSACTCM